MGIALLTASGWLTSLLALAAAPSRFKPLARAARGLRPSMAERSRRSAAGSPATASERACTLPRRSRPLRVVRVAEPGYQPGAAGRMVISGRMADVCAELDRLAALEASLRPS